MNLGTEFLAKILIYGMANVLKYCANAIGKRGKLSDLQDGECQSNY